MYRELARNEEELRHMREFGLRYDITVIPPAKLGKEYVKTAGHYHPTSPRADVSYAEIYQSTGRICYLSSAESREEGQDSGRSCCRGSKGDIVFVQPDYGYITVNRLEKILKMANWVCRDFSSLYEPVKKFGGGAYFFLEDGFVRNPKSALPRKVQKTILGKIF